MSYTGCKNSIDNILVHKFWCCSDINAVTEDMILKAKGGPYGLNLFVYLFWFYVAFNTVQVMSQWVVTAGRENVHTVGPSPAL